MQTYYYFTNELYHHGIKGQRWGVRRYQNEDGSLTPAGEKRYAIQEAKSQLKATKEKYKQANKELMRQPIFASRDNMRKKEEAKKRRDEAEMEMIDAKANLAKAKKGEKGEFKSYRNSMRKYGLPGSSFDMANDNKAAKVYDRIAVKKGEEYAKKVEKSVRNQLVANVATSAAVTLGATAVAAIVSRQYN